MVCLVRYMGPCIPSPYASMLTNFASIIILVCDMQAWVRHFLACVFALQMKKSKCGCRCKVRNLTLKIERGKISEEMNEFGWIHIRFACMSWISLEEQVINTNMWLTMVGCQTLTCFWDYPWVNSYMAKSIFTIF